ncbi:hypothetical protein [Nitrosomonas ureae]|uniref:Uncharacterized protein n=1 Tax=Nitrosomonas ureae TaxID=44577 RepID=A0A0S3ALK3_9PROT|nr:hypothetical protein [Nitrosomonas ureae]ALQ52062.1 hypothetical protein ATY38_13060 [Nitrosomonas ureae]ALQ52079.1 hypothetical protein ATY38_13155 [Nitrosomonas ureae]PTQ79716.1 hypothetical protein C8R28_104630 [Nitrosomonas ureae]PXX06166.1 hypothetical protein C8R27_1662 [Nitrosomonas ureae]SDU38023.1 hypothetical protein SAMN05216406_1882 [Nitrosomonas ureae]
MKIQVLGVKRMSGTAKESGNPFEMAALLAIVPIEQVSGSKFNVQGYGYEVGEMLLEPESIKQFEAFKYPCALELTMELVNYRGKISQIVTGTTTPQPVKSVSNG